MAPLRGCHLPPCPLPWLISPLFGCPWPDCLLYVRHSPQLAVVGSFAWHFRLPLALAWRGMAEYAAMVWGPMGLASPMLDSFLAARFSSSCCWFVGLGWPAVVIRHSLLLRTFCLLRTRAGLHVLEKSAIPTYLLWCCQFRDAGNSGNNSWAHMLCVNGKCWKCCSLREHWCRLECIPTSMLDHPAFGAFLCFLESLGSLAFPDSSEACRDARLYT